MLFPPFLNQIPQGNRYWKRNNQMKLVHEIPFFTGKENNVRHEKGFDQLYELPLISPQRRGFLLFL